VKKMREREEENIIIPESHPRAKSLKYRELLVHGYNEGVVATAGLIAHGRGEAFDYLLGEKTHDFAREAMEAAVALFLVSKHPVFSVNGNVAALVAKEYVELAKKVNAKLEVNLFYRTKRRERAIERVLLAAGAGEVLGVDEKYRAELPEIEHLRRYVDKRGILIADTVFVPLEDGDRTMALRKMGKNVVTIDLNPLSRTAQWANITIVDNIVRAVPGMIRIVEKMRNKPKEELLEILKNYDNNDILRRAFEKIKENIEEWASKGLIIEEVKKYPKFNLKFL